MLNRETNILLNSNISKNYRYLLVPFILLLLSFKMFFLFDKPLDSPPINIDFNDSIINTIREAQSKVYDLDKDGKINCIDYALIFKLVWDEKFPRLKNNCTIIRNRNSNTDMNHLFIYITDTNKNIIAVEPGTYNPCNYKMENIWGDRYDPLYNKYGETAYWLSIVVK